MTREQMYGLCGLHQLDVYPGNTHIQLGKDSATLVFHNGLYLQQLNSKFLITLEWWR